MSKVQLDISIKLKFENGFEIACTNTTFPLTVDDLMSGRRFVPKPGSMFLSLLADKLIVHKGWTFTTNTIQKSDTNLTDALAEIAEKLGGTERRHSGRTQILTKEK